jgi:DNA-binding MarR family transcriptional regulator
MSSRWLTDEQERTWRAYLQVHARLTAQLNRELQAAGLSLADYEVLVNLTDVPDERLRPYALQATLEWEQSRLSHHLSRMQRRGLVSREDCDDDGRGAWVVLTAAGRDAITAAAPAHVDAVKRLFFDHLTARQVSTIRIISTRLLDHLDRG